MLRVKMEGDLVVGPQVGGTDMLPSGTPGPYGDNDGAVKRELQSRRSPSLCFRVHTAKVTLQRQHRGRGCVEDCDGEGLCLKPGTKSGPSIICLCSPLGTHIFGLNKLSPTHHKNNTIN